MVFRKARRRASRFSHAALSSSSHGVHETSSRGGAVEAEGAAAEAAEAGTGADATAGAGPAAGLTGAGVYKVFAARAMEGVDDGFFASVSQCERYTRSWLRR